MQRSSHEGRVRAGGGSESVRVGRQNCCHMVRDGDSSARLNEEALWGPLWAKGRAGTQLGKSWVSAVAGVLVKGSGQH